MEIPFLEAYQLDVNKHTLISLDPSNPGKTGWIWPTYNPDSTEECIELKIGEPFLILDYYRVFYRYKILSKHGIVGFIRIDGMDKLELLA